MEIVSARRHFTLRFRTTSNCIGVVAPYSLPYSRLCPHALTSCTPHAHPTVGFTEKHVHPPIIAQFVSRKMREEWLMAARRTRNLNASDIDSALNNSPVFINEHLTAHNKAILGRARRLQREKKISFAGFFNGKILVKVAEGAETERVTALADLDKFDK
ncbi:hypothetical protein J6590_017470 [Homalodisca vitripennis]|nr:hypothetical protein J6590_017470 [Homalodisca vitripennis]